MSALRKRMLEEMTVGAIFVWMWGWVYIIYGFASSAVCCTNIFLTAFNRF